MKRLAILTLCLLSVTLFQCNSGRSKSTTTSNGTETVKISENDQTYALDASFHADKTVDVYQYINSYIGPPALFDSTDDRVDGSTSLSDGGTIHVKAQAGELTLTFDKRANSPEAYARAKELCEGVKKICNVR
jgi:hypothetical protein